MNYVTRITMYYIFIWTYGYPVATMKELNADDPVFFMTRFILPFWNTAVNSL